MIVGKIIVDIASSLVDKVFDYILPDETFEIGMRVYVPFGKIIKEGYIVDITTESDYDPSKLKTVISKIDNFPVILPEQLELAKFMKKKFNTGLCDAIRLFLPSEMRQGRVKELIKIECFIPDEIKAKEYLSSVRKNATGIIGIINELLSKGSVLQNELNKKFNSGSLKKLIDDKIVQTKEIKFKRSPYTGLDENKKEVTLTATQQGVVDRITDEHNVFLLHGVTGSGKTEVYMSCMKKIIDSGKTGIMLVPEISLTPQVLMNFRSRFGENVALLHSGLSAGERFDEWQRILFGEAKIVIGARSAIFAPIKNIGLIVIDEEHDNSYNSDSNPRYNTIEVAKERARLSSSSLVLGSATPSLVSYHHAMVGDYQLLEMKERINKRELPPLHIVDMGEEIRTGNTGVFSTALKNALTKTVAEGNQAMLFINRRGFSSFLMCKKCGWVAKCDACDVSLVYHKYDRALKCHYCGNRYKVLTECPECGNTELSNGATGTQKVVQELQELLPNVSIGRMDNDTTKTKDSHLKILSDFRNGKTQILVGTQMIAKGHDFPSVTLVGIIDADISLYQTSYAATEQTFELITQVAGRAGRADKSGEIILQTYVPRHYVYKLASYYDYPAFYKKEINLRQITMYPPFSKIMRILFTSEDEKLAKETAKVYYEEVKKVQQTFQKDFIYLGVMKSPIGKIQNKYRIQILLRIRPDNEDVITKRLFEITEMNKQTGVSAFIEINPQSLS
ncbi:MAG: primosomal protein N' [Clostridiales bacterium]|nr:primosomal protein N' [Clostridiales bacterium]